MSKATSPLVGTVGFSIDIDVSEYRHESGVCAPTDLSSATGLKIQLIPPGALAGTEHAAILVGTSTIRFVTQSPEDLDAPGLWGAVGLYSVLGREESTSRASFNVAPSPPTPGPPLYLSPEEMRGQWGVGEEITDERLAAEIRTWQDFIIRACRQWFHPRAMDIRIDGNGSDTLFLDSNVIRIESIWTNDSPTPLAAESYALYKRPGNPMLRLKHGKFLRGVQNQRILGEFGRVESDGSPPPLIKRAVAKLVLEKLSTSPALAHPVAPPAALGSVLEEETDGHRIKRAFPGGRQAERAPGLSGVTSDREILDVIKLYRAPMAIGG